MSSFTDNVSMALSCNPLMDFIGADNVKRLQDGIVDIILRKVEEDLGDYCQNKYLVSPDDYNEIIDQAFDGVKDDIKQRYMEEMMKDAELKFEKWKCNMDIK